MKRILLLVLIIVFVVGCGEAEITGSVIEEPSSLASFDTIGDPVLVGDKLAFPVTKDGAAFIFFDGQELGEAFGFDRVRNLISGGGSPVWVAEDATTSYLLVGGVESASFPFIFNNSLTTVGGEATFVIGTSRATRNYATRGGEGGQVVVGSDLQTDYNGILINPVDVGGLPAYYTLGGLVVHGTQEIVPQNGLRYMFEIDDVNGKLAFAGYVDRTEEGLVYYDGTTREASYPGQVVSGPHVFRFPFGTEGKVGYVAIQNYRSGAYRASDAHLFEQSHVVVEDSDSSSTELGTQFDGVHAFFGLPLSGGSYLHHLQNSRPLDIGGEVAFLGATGSGINYPRRPRVSNTVIVHGTSVLGDEYGYACCPRDINGKLAFTGFSKEDGDNFYRMSIVYEDEEIGGRFDEVSEPQVFGGNLVFSARTGELWEVVSFPLE